MSTDKNTPTLHTARLAMKLKHLKRAGWQLHGIADAESVADHSFGTAFLALLLAPSFDVDETKLIKMALIHDIGEAIIGDVITQRGDTTLSNQVSKLDEEKSAVAEIFGSVYPEYTELFNEYIENKTPEARLVHQIDKLEMALQASEYCKTSGKNLDEFFVNASKHITDNRLSEILHSLTR